MRARFGRLFGAGLLLLAAEGAHAAGGVPPALDAEARARGSVRVIVRLAPAAGHELLRRQDEALARVGAGARAQARRYRHLALVALEASASDLQELAGSPDVIGIELDGPLAAPSLDTTGPLVGATATAAAGFAGSGAAIAVLDTGVDSSHPYLAGRVVAEACFSAAGSCPDGGTTQLGAGAGAPCTYSGACFHGTHVAGIAAGEHATYQGMAPDAQIAAIQIFSRFTGAACSGTGYDPCVLAYPSDIIAGIDYARTLAATLPLAATNMSFGSGQYFGRNGCDNSNTSTKLAIDTLLAVGVASVAASGNDGWSDAMAAPACISSATGVGATTDAHQVWSSSNSVYMLDLLAPGVTVRSAVPGGSTAYASGTSMATPHVSGALAVLRQADRTATIASLVATLQSTGLPITDSRNNLVRSRIRLATAVKSRAPAACYDGLDNDGDGHFDFPADPGCASGLGATEAPACDDDVDNDADGKIDWDGGAAGGAPDPTCVTGAATTEGTFRSCGIGPELALVLPLALAWRAWRANRKRTRRDP